MARAFALGKEDGKDYFGVVRVYEGEEHEGPFEDYELQEPVYVEGVSVSRIFSKGRVFWIARIVENEPDLGPQVWLTFTRYGGHGDLSVCPSELRKLPAMLRIAHEASD